MARPTDNFTHKIKVYVLQCTSRSSGEPIISSYEEEEMQDYCKVSSPVDETDPESVYLDEDQAYAAAIRRQVEEMEYFAHKQENPSLRDDLKAVKEMVANSKLDLQDRFLRLRDFIEVGEWYQGHSYIDYDVKECYLKPFVEVREGEELMQSDDDGHSDGDDEGGAACPPAKTPEET